MTEIRTDEDHVREALRRLNPEFHEHDASWSALQRIIEQRDEAREWANASEDSCRMMEDRVNRLVANSVPQVRALISGIRVASQYLDTDRGDLDGWIDTATTLTVHHCDYYGGVCTSCGATLDQQ